MSRSRLTIILLAALTVLLGAAGCSHDAPQTAPVAPSATSVAALPPAAPASPPGTPPTAFQPYTLLPSPPPAPPVATPRHRVLHLTRFHNRVYLADSDRHLYEAGRDTQGHVYPIYRDPVDHAAYPLYYDPARDNLYRVARNDDGRFYRNYVGQPGDRFYASDRDYERVRPSDQDRPIVTDSYNTYNYNSYNYGPGYHGDDSYHAYDDPYYRRAHPYYTGYRPPPAHHASHHNNDWLWAIPVIIGAYLLLQPHHHHLSPPPRYAAPATVIVRQNTPITIINQNRATMVYRPVYSPQPLPHARRNYPAISRPAAFAPMLHPSLRTLSPAAVPAHPATLASPPAHRPVLQAHVTPPSRPAFQRVHRASRPVRPALYRRPETFAAQRPAVHPAARPLERSRAVIRSLPAKPASFSRPAPPRREIPVSAPRVERREAVKPPVGPRRETAPPRSAPRVVRLAARRPAAIPMRRPEIKVRRTEAAPRREERVVRPQPVRAAPPRKGHQEARKKPADRPKDAAKPAKK